MKQTHARYLLILIVLFVLSFRLFFAFQTTGFSDDASYQTLSRINSISADPLNLQLSSTLIYDYIVTFVYSLFGIIGLKVFNNALSIFLVILNYKIAKYITEDEYSSLLVALVGGFIPVYVLDSFNSINPFNFFFVLYVFQIYNFLKIRTRLDKHYYMFIIVTIIMPLVSSLSILLAFSLLAFMLFAMIENLDVTGTKIDLIIFSSIYLIWTQFLVYKNSFLDFGIQIIYQNIPSTLLNNYFTGTNLASMIVEIGFIPFFFGIFVLYFYIFKKQRYLLSLFPFFLVLVFLIFFKLINLKIGLILIGELFVLIFTFFFRVSYGYVHNSKLSKFWPGMVTLFLIIFTLTSILPIANAINNMDKEQNLYEILDKNYENKTIFAPLSYGSIISASGANSIISNDFLDYNKPGNMLEDIDNLYSAFNFITVLNLLDKYEADYVLYDQKIVEKYSDFKFKNAKCVSEDAFELVYGGGQYQLYKVNCGVNYD